MLVPRITGFFVYVESGAAQLAAVMQERSGLLVEAA